VATDENTADSRHGGTILTFRVVIEPDEDGVFVAEVPVLPGCVSQGRTRTEAIENIKEAIAAYLESLKRHSEPIPPPVSEEIVEVPI
jgi:predicted RNase H-like HicB family nuclease